MSKFGFLRMKLSFLIASNGRLLSLFYRSISMLYLAILILSEWRTTIELLRSSVISSSYSESLELVKKSEPADV